MQFDKRALALTLAAFAMPACSRVRQPSYVPAVGAEIVVSDLQRRGAVQYPKDVFTNYGWIVSWDFVFKDGAGRTMVIRESNRLNERPGIKLDGLKNGDTIRVTSVEPSKFSRRYAAASVVTGAEIVRK